MIVVCCAKPSAPKGVGGGIGQGECDGKPTSAREVDVDDVDTDDDADDDDDVDREEGYDAASET